MWNNGHVERERTRLCKISFVPYLFKFYCLRVKVNNISFEVIAFSFMFVLFMGKSASQGKCSNPFGHGIIR